MWSFCALLMVDARSVTHDRLTVYCSIEGMTCTKRTKEARKAEEGNKKTAEKGERIGRRAQTTSYRKSKELGGAKRDSPKVGELHDEAPTTLAPDIVGESDMHVLLRCSAVKHFWKFSGRRYAPLIGNSAADLFLSLFLSPFKGRVPLLWTTLMHIWRKRNKAIFEPSSPPEAGFFQKCVSSRKKEKPKGGDKSKRLSRIKELLRWVAASQAEKGGKYIAIGAKVMHFRSRSSGKAPSQKDNDSTNSPKISFSWESLSCSTTSSAYSAFSLTTPSKNNRKGAARASTDSLGHEDLMTSDNCIEEKKVVKGDEDHCSPRAGNWITTAECICGARALKEEGLNKGDDQIRN
ncbi:hypothetical protein Sjap_026309 [Stephania japonica]|uniref:Uncharacterized protein n=1 Tax=Stephania japonica TaxID=461633 RepID=A0AAP0EB62_9MAGN